MHNLDVVIRQIDHSVTELKRIRHYSIPESLLTEGLETALSELCQSLQSNKTAIIFSCYGILKDLPAILQADIFFIIRQIVLHAVQHSEARAIIVQCSRGSETFHISVEDNGKGFDIAAMSGENATGINMVEGQVKFLQGKINITSEINKGTTFIIELDLPD